MIHSHGYTIFEQYFDGSTREGNKVNVVGNETVDLYVTAVTVSLISSATLHLFCLLLDHVKHLKPRPMSCQSCSSLNHLCIMATFLASIQAPSLCFSFIILLALKQTLQLISITIFLHLIEIPPTGFRKENAFFFILNYGDELLTILKSTSSKLQLPDQELVQGTDIIQAIYRKSPEKRISSNIC